MISSAGSEVLLAGAEVTPDIRQQLVSAAEAHGKAVLVGPVFDTIKLASRGFVQATLDRDQLRWPLAWAYRSELKPGADPPPATWFEGAAVVEDGG